MASITKENSDSDLTEKMVSVFTVHILQSRACVLSEKGFHLCTGEEHFVSSPSCAAPGIGRYSHSKSVLDLQPQLPLEGFSERLREWHSRFLVSGDTILI